MGATTITSAGGPLSLREGEPGEVPALVIAWSLHEPHRVGEVALFPARRGEVVLGRGGEEEGGQRATFVRQRPGVNDPTKPLAASGLSRRQLVLHARATTLEVESVGRSPLLVNGREETKCEVVPGDTLLVRGQMLLLCTRRPAVLPAM